MRYLSEDETTRMMGLGYVGDLYQDVDGHLYEWVEGVDERGDPSGFLQGLSEPQVAELSGLGALYEAPDGTLFQVEGLADEEAAETEAAQTEAAKTEESGETEAPKAMGPGRRLHPRVRAWRRRRGMPSQRPRPGVKGASPRKKGGLLKKLLPIAKVAAGFIPAFGPVARAALDVGSRLLMKKPGVAGYAGLGALYAAPDGTVYQVQGLAEEDLDGLYADEELRGFAENEDLRGFAEDEELRGLDEDEELRGLEQGYVREEPLSGLEAYVPVTPPETRWFKSPTETPELWRPLW